MCKPLVHLHTSAFSLPHGSGSEGWRWPVQNLDPSRIPHNNMHEGHEVMTLQTATHLLWRACMGA
jgi:hypothetical protein